MAAKAGPAGMMGIALLVAATGSPARAEAQPQTPAPTVEALQRQIDELKAMVAELRAAQAAREPAPTAAARESAPTAAAREALAAAPPPAPPANGGAVLAERVAEPPVPREPQWYERVSLRGYAQLRVNEFLSGDRTAPPGVARLRSVHDGGIDEGSNFTFRRIRLVLEGDLSDRLSFYLQPDFANNVADQSVGERREGFVQLRDAYVDWFLDPDRRLRLRFGQSKVPFGWENLQSSSDRLTLDRSDGINSAVPSERDLGIVAYYTPDRVQRIWDRLDADGQKLFGNYGAFGLALYNGQGVNRQESNEGLMTVAMATWPFALDGIAPALAGQVAEIGLSATRNRVQPEVRTGGVSPVAFPDERIGIHAILYPQPFGLQAEWNWGRGPEYDPALDAITTRPLEGGYVQGMMRVTQSPVGPFMPYARWQRYRGGWKALVNAPRFDTTELELGIEFQPWEPLELTVAYARMRRRDTDERRDGQAEGDLIRTQLQWNY